jgi:hypothetical protein
LFVATNFVVYKYDYLFNVNSGGILNIISYGKDDSGKSPQYIINSTRITLK